MRRAARIDGNQIEIVKSLREEGLSVALTHVVGYGFPDIVVGGPMPCSHCGQPILQNLLVEIKDPAQPVYAQALTVQEAAFHRQWLGMIIVADSTARILLQAGRLKMS